MRKKNIVIFIVLIVGMTVGGLFWYSNRTSYNGSLPMKDRRLTEAQYKIYKDRVLKAEVYLKSLNPSQADYRSEQVSIYIYLGQQYYGIGDLSKSQEMYAAALRLDPNHDQSLVGLSIVLSEAGKINESQQLLEQAIKNHPKNAEIWIRYIDMRQTIGVSAEDMEDLYIKALSETERHINVLTRSAQFYEQQGDVGKALALWEEAVQSYPSNPAYQQEVNRLKKINK